MAAFIRYTSIAVWRTDGVVCTMTRCPGYIAQYVNNTGKPTGTRDYH